MSNSSPTEQQRGRLKVFLGYAAGVGKTYQMLEEAQESRRQGVDVVVGYFEPHARPETIAKLEGLEVIPRRQIEYRGSRFEDMDTDAILARAPQLCVVDEFPHTNVPGSARAKRWQDVVVLLEAGIDVLTTMNVQHLESLNDQVQYLTGVRMRETIPDWVLQQASEVVMVDLTPRALLNRLDRGVVYQGEKAQKAKENFFKESTLVALRELALRETAFEIEARHGDSPGAVAAVSATAERILVCLTPEASSTGLLRRGRRVADYLHGSCLAVAVLPRRDDQQWMSEDEQAIKQHLQYAQDLHIETHVLRGDNPVELLVDFARHRRVTQVYIARPNRSRWSLPFRQDLVSQIVHAARDMEVTLVAERPGSTAQRKAT